MEAPRESYPKAPNFAAGFDFPTSTSLYSSQQRPDESQRKIRQNVHLAKEPMMQEQNFGVGTI